MTTATKTVEKKKSMKVLKTLLEEEHGVRVEQYHEGSRYASRPELIFDGGDKDGIKVIEIVEKYGYTTLELSRVWLWCGKALQSPVWRIMFSSKYAIQ